ncbi:hypothetical protein H6P81_018119 [Aristolochia fimbriata]|uniref:Uncharacterized protein n=1 Tax=Aristolochia fimbriata TaxID=158543 RepID=A0AAV7E033_ARIFI|nr:hypothetical protein H6P81_018119 [Aristolochia fimbriata]
MTTIQTLLLGASEVSQEEVPPSEAEAIAQTGSIVVTASEDIEVAETLAVTSSMGPVLELEALPPVREVTPVVQEAVAPVIQEAVTSVVQEAVTSVVQEAVTSLPLPAPPMLAFTVTHLVTPSQQLQSDFRGMVLRFQKVGIAPRMLSPDVVHDSSLAIDAKFVISKLREVGHDVTCLQDYAQKFQGLTEVESLAGERTSRISKDSAESKAREALDVLSCKLDNAKVTLDKAAEDLSQAKLDQEDAHERLELAREQAQSADTKVVYLATQVE